QLWRRMVLQFGLGQSLGIDLQNVKPGYIPSPAFYDRWYGKNRWAFSTIYSLGIGQGEVEITPLQMANMAATIANRGFYIDPHLVKKIGGQAANQKALEPQQTNINRTYFDYVTEAMRAVVEDPGGTARRAKIPDITVCGKTGTVQNPHGENHSVFMAFAPKNNPQIAVAVYVENAGYGGSWAAPVASLMIEKYLTDSIQRTQVEERILNKKFNNYAPFQQ
ncbi:MAG: penicillin-binding transpeptidase domain-containing protein, partial [Bacteroidales bacterium]